MKKKVKRIIAVMLSLSLAGTQAMPALAMENPISEPVAGNDTVAEVIIDEAGSVDPCASEEITDSIMGAYEKEHSECVADESEETEKPEMIPLEEDNLMDDLEDTESSVSAFDYNKIEEKIIRIISAAKTAQTFKDDSIADGVYEPDSFSYTGGTGKVNITCTAVKVKGEKTYAKIVFSSASYKQLKSAGRAYDGIIDEIHGTATYYIPVEINKEYQVTGTTFKMSTPHDIDYLLKITISSSSKQTEESGFDLPELEEDELPDGIFKPDSFSYTGGSGKVVISCPAVKIADGKAYGKIIFNSAYYVKVKSADKEYEGIIDAENNTATYYVPVEINGEYVITGTTTKMGDPHDVNYTINIVITKDSEETTEEGFNDMSNAEENPAEPGNPSEPEPVPTPDPVPVPKPEKLSNGTFIINADTDNRMFYIQENSKGEKKATLVKNSSGMTVTVTLTGQGYDYLYLGTAQEAEKAAKKNWIKYKEKNGYYTYTFKISKLDKNLKISAHSKKYDKWYEHTIIFYSAKARKVKDGTTVTPSVPKKDIVKPVNSEPGKPSTWQADSNRGTSAVDSSTGLADGVYALDSFSWSGGTGRLAYIRCTKLTVTGGQAYATIEFGSSSYDQLKANGRVYMKSGSGLSTFTIPVELNSNNTIVGRSVAMSQPHWISYTIYPYLAEAESASSGEKGTPGEKAAVVNSNKLTDKAPEIPGLKFKSETKVEYAKCFRIYNYEKGVRLIQIDMSKNSALKYKKKDINQADEIEYDDDGKPIAKSQAEITEELYHSNVVNYLLVPEKVEVPAGLDKEMIIVNLPADKTYTASKMAVKFIGDLEKSKKIQIQGHYLKTEYKDIIKEKINLAIFSGMIIPEKTDEKAKDDKKLAEDEKERVEEQKTELEKVEKRFATLGIPFIVDRSGAEESKLAKAEWVKVYGAIYGCQKEAKAAFREAKETLEKEGKIENEK